MADTTGLMTGKTVLVTGGTGGIGKATAAGLAARGARVGIVGRDLARTRAAAADIAATSGNPAVDAFGADMSSQAEVRRLAREVLDMYPRLEVLVNNVGGSGPPAGSPPTGRSTPSPSITSRASRSLICCSTGSRPAPRPGSSPCPPALKPTADPLRRSAGRAWLLVEPGGEGFAAV